MASNRKMAAAYLKQIAASAETLAYEIENGKLWEGEFSQRIAAIRAALDKAQREGNDR